MSIYLCILNVTPPVHQIICNLPPEMSCLILYSGPLRWESIFRCKFSAIPTVNKVVTEVLDKLCGNGKSEKSSILHLQYPSTDFYNCKREVECLL